MKCKVINSAKTIRIGLLVAVSILISCKEENDRTRPANLLGRHPVSNEAILQGVSPRNPANPLDSAGIWHNIILDSVRVFIDTTHTSEYTKITRFITGFSARHLHTSPQDLDHIAAKVLADSTNGYINIINQSPYPQLVKNQIIRLVGIIKSTTDISAYGHIKKRILQFESSIITDQGISSEDRQVILRMASIARYSVFHWSRYYITFPPKEEAQAGPLRWFVTVTSDITTGVGDIVGGGNGGINDVIVSAAAVSSYWYRFLSNF